MNINVDHQIIDKEIALKIINSLKYINNSNFNFNELYKQISLLFMEFTSNYYNIVFATNYFRKCDVTYYNSDREQIIKHFIDEILNIYFKDKHIYKINDYTNILNSTVIRCLDGYISEKHIKFNIINKKELNILKKYVDGITKLNSMYYRDMEYAKLSEIILKLNQIINTNFKLADNDFLKQILKSHYVLNKFECYYDDNCFIVFNLYNRFSEISNIIFYNNNYIKNTIKNSKFISIIDFTFPHNISTYTNTYKFQNIETIEYIYTNILLKNLISNSIIYYNDYINKERKAHKKLINNITKYHIDTKIIIKALNSRGIRIDTFKDAEINDQLLICISCNNFIDFIPEYNDIVHINNIFALIESKYIECNDKIKKVIS